MASPKITAALSVYNVAEYLPRCLDCVVNQTFRDIEILCIDDCSTDDTWQILQDYAARDNRIRTIRQDENSGLSVSRNRAIDEAKGEYIWMLDGDDLFALDLLEKAYEAAENQSADITIWDYRAFENDDELQSKPSAPSRLKDMDASNYKQLLSLPSFMWIRLYRLDFLKRLNTRFTPGLTKQDIPINWLTLTHQPTVALVPEVMAFYRMRPTSTTNRKGKSLFSLYKVMDIVGDNLKADGIYEEYRNEYLVSRLQLLHGMYDFIVPELKAEALAIIKERLADADVKDFLKTKASLLTRRSRLFYGMLDGNLLASLQYKSIIMMRSIYRKITMN